LTEVPSPEPVTSFSVIPCVDVLGGRAVRLMKGDPERATVYFASALEAARHWAGLGAPLLHLVDLDAALGSGDNRASVEAIAAAIKTPLELGGGVRSREQAEAWLERVHRVVVTTLAVQEPAAVRALLERYGPERVAVSLDAKDGRVAIKGWQETSDLAATDLARRVSDWGVRYVIYTDVSRDGTMQGVNAEPVARMREAFPHTLLAGGGVGSDADLALYERLGLEGAIVGRALYEGRVTYPRTA
jgi:phosphoribosylformimino-5-aminoimidazole carboxamide ribotide isomerase